MKVTGVGFVLEQLTSLVPFQALQLGVHRKRLRPGEREEPGAKHAEPRPSDMLCGLVARSLLLF